MPCIMTQCVPRDEVQRFLITFVGVYIYHFVWDRLFIRPIVNGFYRHQLISKDKIDKMRESLWKNIAVGTFFTFALYVGFQEEWFMQRDQYFKGWPYVASENLRWYYMIYLSFWLQSVDFLLNLTNKHYQVKRKDNAEMLIHHFATISLMIFSYLYDFTKIGLCVLLIHDVNDLLLETAKIFVYLEWENLANVFFGIFALVWYIVRWGFYSYNILYSVYVYAYLDIVEPIFSQHESKNLRAGGLSPNTWWWLWQIFSGFLVLLFILHLYWGYLIGRMVLKALSDGNVEKDIRSESEDEAPSMISEKDHKSPSIGQTKTRRRRAPKAE